MGLEENVKCFGSKKVLVIGDILLDNFLWGEVERVNPEQPAAILMSVDEESFMLGGAGNVANNIAALGADVNLFGIIGNDIYGEEIKKLCYDAKIKFNYIYHNKTLVKNRIMAHGQQLCRFDKGEKEKFMGERRSLLSKLEVEKEDKIFNQLKEDIGNYDIVILSDYNKYLFKGGLAQRILNLTRDKSVKIVAAPKPKNVNLFMGAYLVCVNRSEAEEISRITYSRNEETLKRIGEKIYLELKPKYVAITCGGDGVFSYHNGESNLIRTKAKKVADVTGAGDTFIAALSLGLATGLDVHDASVIANAAAGVVVEKPGTTTATREEVIRYLR
ncbi:MAG: PfkB family carbohydrate kinase [Nanoarchaeota archaeon]|nr:PfkB family carbohydrate kinase [Nanoarchaeota archaeon]